MLKALAHRPIARLWFGQALSSIGDEIYRVGLTWMAVQTIGADTGYLTAAQFAALMILSFIGGKWADQWDPLRTLIGVDLLRAVIVVIPVVYSFFAPVPLSLLVGVALALAGLSAFFDPALQTVLPRFAPDLYTLRAATGLMATTIRLARLVGPAVVGLLAGIIPVVHFFTIDALSFLISACSVRGLSPRPEQQFKRPATAPGVWESITAGFRAVASRPGLGFIFTAKAITGGTWNLAYCLGFALLAQELAPNDARTFGLLIAAYGLGNFAGALVVGNMHRARPALMMFVGFAWLGIGFVGMALAPSLNLVMAAAAFAGFSGTMNEVTFFDLVQSRFPVSDMPKVLRLRMATDNATTLVLMMMAPLILKVMSVRMVIGLCGGLWVLVGLMGCGSALHSIENQELKPEPKPSPAARSPHSAPTHVALPTPIGWSTRSDHAVNSAPVD